MKGIVVYESWFGNTEHVARAVAAGLSARMETELIPVDQAPVDISGRYDLVVVGGPTHAFSMSRPTTREDAMRQGATGRHATGIREWLDRLPEQPYAGVAAAFDTRVEKVRHLPGSAAKKAAKVLHRHGLVMLEKPQSFYVSGVDGPLLDGETDRAEMWGQALSQAVHRTIAAGTADTTLGNTSVSPPSAI